MRRTSPFPVELGCRPDRYLYDKIIMKFLHVYCERRNTSVFLNLAKIVLISKKEAEGMEERCLIEMEGIDEKGTIEVRKSAEELVRMIHGEDKATIGFRAGR